MKRLWHRLARLANPPLLIVEMTATGVRCTRGTPPAAWLADCADVAESFGLTRGQLDVVLFAGRWQLRFSPELPRACHQRFRNVFGVHQQNLQPPRRR